MIFFFVFQAIVNAALILFLPIELLCELAQALHPAEFENGKEFEHAGGKYYVEKKETPILMDKEGKPFDDCNRRKSSK